MFRCAGSARASLRGAGGAPMAGSAGVMDPPDVRPAGRQHACDPLDPVSIEPPPTTCSLASTRSPDRRAAALARPGPGATCDQCRPRRILNALDRTAGVVRGRYSALGFATACWGTAAAATKLGLGAFQAGDATSSSNSYSPAVSCGCRPSLSRRRPRIGPLRDLRAARVSRSALPFLLILIGLRSSTAANAALLVSLESFVAVGFAVMIGTERVTRVFATGGSPRTRGCTLALSSSRGASGFAYRRPAVPRGDSSARCRWVVARRIALFHAEH